MMIKSILLTAAMAQGAEPSCAFHPECAHLDGDCCPNNQGLMLDCCGDATQAPVELGCDGVPDSGKQFDDCDVCDGGNADQDDCGVCFGNNQDKDACGVCFGTNTDANTCGEKTCVDNADFRGENNRKCKWWRNRNCNNSMSFYDLSEDGKKELFENCPVSCGVCPDTVWFGFRRAGGWGGRCTCPNSGHTYLVGDNHDSCESLACEGGQMLECTKRRGPWKHLGVTCK